MAYNTGNPVGSIDPRDLYDNAANLDRAMNSLALRWNDRFGVSRPSWASVIGYINLGNYAGAIQISSYNQIVKHDGEYWKLSADVTLPYTTTGSWSTDAPDFVSVGDAVLRSELADAATPGAGFSLVAITNTDEEVRASAAVTHPWFDPGDVRRYGAACDGVTDDTSAFEVAISCNRSITVPQGLTCVVNGLDVSGWAGTIWGHGATLTGTSANGVIYKTDHGYRLSVVGLTFAGTAKGIKYVATPSGSQYDDFSIESCQFTGSDYGIYLVGAREGRIFNCSFRGTNGLYRQATVNTDVIGCYWKNCTYGINDDGDGTAYSAGLKVIGGTMIGCTYGIQTGRNDFVMVQGCMIDYCDNPVRIIGTDIASFIGNYITTRTTNPAVYIDRYDVSAVPREIRFYGNTISSNTNDVTSDCIVAKYISSGTFDSNSITFYWRYGIEFSNCTNLRIENDKFSADPGSTAPTKYSVYESAGGSNSNYVRHNELNNDPSVISAQLEQNRGFITQNAGEVTVSSGNTTYDITHGLSYTPNKYDITLTPTNSEAAGKNPYVSAVDATKITIAFTTATAGNAGVAWVAKKRVT